MTSLLVTNDFPPKIGGIQSYLYELWRRLPASETTVLTTSFAGDKKWDSQRKFRVVRAQQSQFLPTRALARRIDGLALEVGADVVFLDPWLPLGHLGPGLRAAPYVVVVHGAEVTVPGRLPGSRQLGARVLHAAAGVVAASEYSAWEAVRAAQRSVAGVVIPPGVDVERFRPIDPDERAAVRKAFGLDADRPLVLGVSRLVPRKGFDVLIDAVVGVPDLQLVIASGRGRDRSRLAARAARHGIERRVRFLGPVPDAALAPLYASADVFAMPCRDRWFGLETEGFGIVFLEAAAAGVPSVAGRSGGSHEAVVDGVTGLVVDGRDVTEVRRSVARLLDDDELRARMGLAARDRAVTEFSYDRLVERLAPLAAGDLTVLGGLP
ncbi:MAG TPA: glycosyltransferase family 4 protein [Acidimicrobiia bacterium]|nr:glycosyltransferase family 4 protein [Acidimicrobiia bacterium]